MDFSVHKLAVGTIQGFINFIIEVFVAQTMMPHAKLSVLLSILWKQKYKKISVVKN